MLPVRDVFSFFTLRASKAAYILFKVQDFPVLLSVFFAVIFLHCLRMMIPFAGPTCLPAANGIQSSQPHCTRTRERSPRFSLYSEKKMCDTECDLECEFPGRLTVERKIIFLSLFTPLLSPTIPTLLNETRTFSTSSPPMPHTVERPQ